MRVARLLLLLAGASATAYGGWLLYPQLATTWPWLLGGPLLHDALVAPLVGLAGLTLRRLVTDRVRRARLTAGLVMTAVLLMIAVPLTWRPAPAPPNPGLQDRAHALELGTWLAVLWTVTTIFPGTSDGRRGATRDSSTTGTGRRAGRRLRSGRKGFASCVAIPRGCRRRMFDGC